MRTDHRDYVNYTGSRAKIVYQTDIRDIDQYNDNYDILVILVGLGSSGFGTKHHLVLVALVNGMHADLMAFLRLHRFRGVICELGFNDVAP